MHMRTRMHGMAKVAALKPQNARSPLEGYDPGSFHCELLGRDKQPSRQVARLWHALETSDLVALRQRAGSPGRCR